MSKYYYGWIPSVPDQRDLLYEPTLERLPASVDLRPQCPPIYNQGELGSCTANAISAALDFERKRQGEPFITPSRLFVYYNERRDQGTVMSDAGATIRESVKAIVKYGACKELEWPYNINEFTVEAPRECYLNAVQYEALTYKRVAQSVEAIQDVLASGKPVVVGISVYSSFEDPDVVKTGQVPIPKPDEALLGGHAILIVGYENGKWIFRNSWGTSYGDQGYGYLPVAYLTNPALGNDYWTLEVVK